MTGKGMIDLPPVLQQQFGGPFFAVHRPDVPVSGCTLFARTPGAPIFKKPKLAYVIRRSCSMEIAYTYWEADDGWLVGYVNPYPTHLTQGKTLAELEALLADVYQIRREEEKRLAQKRKSGVLRLTVPA
jgi:predicted RNase H-like HicB family nuclease